MKKEKEEAINKLPLDEEQKAKLIAKASRQYNMGLQHVTSERERKRDIAKKVLDTTLPDWQVRVNLLWQNIQLEKSLFLTDELGVKLLATEGVTGEEIMKKAETVLKYDDLDMHHRDIREQIIDDNALYGLSVTAVDNYDVDKEQPMSTCVDALSVVCDPQNYNSSKARFIGLERRLSEDFLENTKGFVVEDDIKFATSAELEQNKMKLDYANNLRYVVVDEGMVDVVDMYTTFEDYKVLATFDAAFTTCFRFVQIEPLTDAEKKNPSLTEFPVQFHRRKPKKGSLFGVSIADEVLQYQDAISRLTNLQLIQANNIALGPDIFIDERLGIDTVTLSERKPGWRIIPVINETGLPTQNGIYTQQLANPSPFVDNMIAKLEGRSEGTTNISRQNFGISQSGSQTKGEIQTLQQNANQILIWIANNYMEGQRQYWLAHYKSYCSNMGKGKKVVAIYEKGNTISLSLSREDFVTEGRVNVIITSRSQEATENDREFNRLLALSNLYMENMKKGYSLNDFLRLLGRKSGVRDFDETRYIAPTPDELDATENLALLNKDIEVPPPSDGQDYLTYWLIYRQALPTKAAQKAQRQYEEAYTTLQKPLEQSIWTETGVGNPQIQNTAMNNISQSLSTAPSTSIATM